MNSCWVCRKVRPLCKNLQLLCGFLYAYLYYCQCPNHGLVALPLWQRIIPKWTPNRTSSSWGFLHKTEEKAPLSKSSRAAAFLTPVRLSVSNSTLWLKLSYNFRRIFFHIGISLGTREFILICDNRVLMTVKQKLAI